MQPAKPSSHWWRAKKGTVASTVFAYVSSVERRNAELFNKFVRLESAYDTSTRTNRYTSAEAMARRIGGAVKAVMTENIIATNVDTVASYVATSDVRIRVQTDGADWSHQRRAKWLERYADGLSELLGVGPKCRTGFKAGAAVKGTGLNKVWVDRFDQVQVTPVAVDNIVVDELEGRNGDPRQLHYRDFLDREDLIAQYPEHEDAIRGAQGTGVWRTWAGYRPIEENTVVVIESWRLPIGPKGHANYVPGRHTITIDGHDLLDEEWHKPFFPFALMRWNAPVFGWYGISLAERILPHQNILNRRNYQINRSLDRKADPIVFVKKGDQNIAARPVPQIGAVAVYNDQVPQVVDFVAVGQETYASRRETKVDAAHEAGVSADMQAGDVPAGIETGAGVREVRQTWTRRFRVQEKAFEQFWLDTVWLVVDCCKDLGKKAPKILHVTDYGRREIEWSKVDMGDLKIQLAAASTLPDSEAGRQQRVIELAQAGVISLDESRQLMDHPDIESKLSMYNATLEAVENAIERILDGERIVPTPMMNMQACVTMAQRTYQKIDVGEKFGGAPEEILEALSDFIAIAADRLNPQPPTGPMGPAPTPDGTMPPDAAAQGAFASGAFGPMAA
jgi:hypothetical protein